MASTYSDRLRIELIGTGDQSGTWGITTNTNLGTIIEEAIAGLAPITMSDADYTLSVVDGGTDEARQMMIWLSGSLSATRNVICPAEEKLYFVKNGTSGGQSIIFKTSAGTGVTIPNGQTAVIICDGTNVVDGITYIPSLGSAWIKNTGAGDTSFNGSQNGLALTATSMDTTNKYAPSIKFGSTDTAFSTTNPKFGAAILGEATEAYAANTDGGMAMSFWTSPDNPGTGSGLAQRMRLTQYGTLALGASGQENIAFLLSSDLTGALTSNTSGYGIYINSEVQPSLTSTSAYVTTNANTSSNGGTPYTVSGLYHYAAGQGTFHADSSVTSQYGFLASSSLTGGTRNYGFFSDIAGEASKTNTNLVRASNVVTVTSSTHGFNQGNAVAITSATPSFNGVFTITSVTTNSFTYSQTGANETATAFGFSTRVNRWGFYGSSAPAFFSGPAIISANSGMDGLRITQAGSGNALVVEDSANPDSTPFVIDTQGTLLKGITSVDTTTPNSGGGVNGLMMSTSASSSSTLTQLTWNTGFSVAPIIQLGKSNSSTVGTRGQVTSGQLLGRISGIGDDGTNFINAAFIDFNVDGTPGTNDMPGRIVLYTTADGASSPTERMRIDNAGNVGIGTSTTGVNDRLRVQGSEARIRSRNSTSGAEVYLGAMDPNEGRVWTSTNTNLTFGTNDAERMRIDNAGQVGIGGSPVAGSTLTIAKNLTGSAGSYAVRISSVAQSDATTAAAGVLTAVGTAAASFTVANLYQYFATQGTFGAGSTVTNQYGYFVSNTLTGATYNYGFLSNIPDGTNRWNFYASGTAPNYLAGNLYVGTLGGDYGRTWRAVFRWDQNAETQLGLINATVGASAEAKFVKIGGTGNSFVNWSLKDLNGSPVDEFAYGSGVLAASWVLGGQERFRINSNGNVGVGVASPLGKLDVRGGSLVASNSASGYINIKHDGSNGSITNNTGQLLFYANGVTNTVFHTNGQLRLLIDGSGNVGVGLSLPPSKLSVFADRAVNGTSTTWRTNNGASFENDCILGFDGSTTYFGNFNNFGLRFITNNTERARITAGGDFQFNSGYGSVATAYGCRAWVNFNGTGTVAIRNDGNVTSVTDSGVGLYTVNFTNAMSSTEYAACVTSDGDNHATADTYLTGSVRVSSWNVPGTREDAANMSVIIVR